MQAQLVLPVGTVIQGQYVVVRLPGTGKPGAVYLVRDRQKNQRYFVLKELLHPMWKDRYLLAYEALKFKRLDHPALPRVYDMFYDETYDRAYMLMEYIEGHDLEQLRLRQPRQLFPLAQVMTLMAPVIDALVYLHSQHPPVIHQHVTPSSIVISHTSKKPVLVHFSTEQDIAFALGTLGFGAPEQYSQGASPHTDIYALGATFYTLLTGNIPIDAFGRLAPTDGNQADLLVPVDQLVPAIPPAVAQAIQRAMAVKSEDRFPTVTQFWHALRVHFGEQSPPSQLPTRGSASPPLPLTMPQTFGSLVATEQPPITDANRAVQRQTAEPLLGDDTAPRVEALPQAQPPETPARGASTRDIPMDRRDTDPSSVGVSLADAMNAHVHLSALPVASVHDVKTLAPLPGAQRLPLKRRRRRWLVVVAILLLLLATVGVGFSFWLATVGQQRTPLVGGQHKATPLPTGHTQPAASPTAKATAVPTSVSSIYPGLAEFYKGTVHDIPGDITTKMSLTSIQQQRSSLIGFFAGLNENGSFKGTITTGMHVQFLVTSSTGQIVLSFDGSVSSDGSMAGTYCRPTSTGTCSDYGLWSVVPSS